ncbi:hypothetical protein BY996DRAFT_7211369 [Phakopsora pachyrhizi]|nr:hypothetical protein BY996DRAFT_7211369 [Phakopsora pachyrhizi]
MLRNGNAVPAQDTLLPQVIWYRNPLPQVQPLDLLPLQPQTCLQHPLLPLLAWPPSGFASSSTSWLPSGLTSSRTSWLPLVSPSPAPPAEPPPAPSLPPDPPLLAPTPPPALPPETALASPASVPTSPPIVSKPTRSFIPSCGLVCLILAPVTTAKPPPCQQSFWGRGKSRSSSNVSPWPPPLIYQAHLGQPTGRCGTKAETTSCKKRVRIVTTLRFTRLKGL